MYFHLSPALCRCQLSPVSGRKEKEDFFCFCLAGALHWGCKSVSPRSAAEAAQCHPCSASTHNGRPPVIAPLAAWLHLNDSRGRNKFMHNVSNFNVLAMSVFQKWQLSSKRRVYGFCDRFFFFKYRAIHTYWRPWGSCAIKLRRHHHPFLCGGKKSHNRNLCWLFSPKLHLSLDLWPEPDPNLLGSNLHMAHQT